MVVPESAEPDRRQRLPWATFALLALLVAGFFTARGEAGLVGDSTPVELESAVELWLNHPYLELDSKLWSELRKRKSGASYEERVAQARAAHVPPPGDEARAEEQSELDLVTRLALRGTDLAPGPMHPFRRYGVVPAAPGFASLWTHWAMQSGLERLAAVLLLIWIAAPALESALGGGLLAALCAAATLAAAAAHVLTRPGSPVPLVGAWGLTTGLVGAFLVRYARHEARVSGLSLALPTWLVLLPWAALGLIGRFSFASAAVETGESLAPTLAALLVGAGGALGLRALRLEERRAARAEARLRASALDPRIRKAQEAQARGSYDQAISLATSVLRERPDDPDALAAIWGAHVAAGRETQGATAAKRLLEVYARHGKLAPAARVWEELSRALPGTRTETTVLLRIVPELVVQARRDAAIAALRAVVTPDGRALSVGQAVRAAELAIDLDPQSALAAARIALAAPDLADDKRVKLEELARSLEESAARLPPPPDPGDSAPLLVTAPAAPHESLQASPPEPAPEPESFELERNDALAPAPMVPRDSRQDELATVFYAAPPAASPHVGPSSVKVTAAVPIELDPAGLRLRVEGAEPTLFTWDHVQAVGVGLVSGLSAKPVVVIDLVQNWAECGDGVLEVLRLRSDSFRARALVGGEGNALEALRALLAQLLARSGAVPLPDGGAARGLPFREFSDPTSYERDVLLHAS
ncbi:MAG TPA: rhomboid family intramembrane serine protease [Myxococcota bacterium]|nr:rhomboid family intramembrane serine protease [Myxococcota bacterium]